LDGVIGRRRITKQPSPFSLAKTIILKFIAFPEALARSTIPCHSRSGYDIETTTNSGKTKTAAPRLQDDGCKRTLLTLHNLFVKHNPKLQAVLGGKKNPIETPFKKKSKVIGNRCYEIFKCSFSISTKRIDTKTPIP
jgi:hypothetical protein